MAGALVRAYCCRWHLDWWRPSLWVAVQAAGAATAHWFAGLAAWVGVANPADAAAYLMRNRSATQSGKWHSWRLAWRACWALHPPAAWGTLGHAALFVVVVVDLLYAAMGPQSDLPG